TGKVGDILLDGFVRPHRHTFEHRPALGLLAGKIRQAGFLLRRCGGAGFLVLWVRGRGSGMRPRQCRSLRPPLSHSVRLFPKSAGSLDRVDAGLPPPRALVVCAMHRTMMPATEWDRELIADLAAKRTGLGKSEVVGVRGLAGADEARLLGDVAKVPPV